MMSKYRHEKDGLGLAVVGPDLAEAMSDHGEVNLLFNVTINDISVIYMYVTAHRCVGGLKKKLDLRSGSQRHRHLVGFFNVPSKHRHGGPPFYTIIRETAQFSRLLRHAGDTEDIFSA